jgi:hypothetical protein
VLDVVYELNELDPLRQVFGYLISSPLGFILILVSYGILAMKFAGSICSLRIFYPTENDKPGDLEEIKQSRQAFIKLEFFTAGFSNTFIILVSTKLSSKLKCFSFTGLRNTHPKIICSTIWCSMSSQVP